VLKALNVKAMAATMTQMRVTSWRESVPGAISRGLPAVPGAINRERGVAVARGQPGLGPAPPEVPGGTVGGCGRLLIGLVMGDDQPLAGLRT